MAEETNKFAEIGSSGLEAWGGWVKMAYATELTWPGCAALYNRIWRSDPEVGVARAVMDSMSSQLDVHFEMHPEIDAPTDDDKAAVDFGNQVLGDIEGGIGEWLNNCMKRVPFYGWGWWEAPLGLRKAGWAPPDSEDPWRSQYDDGLVGYRGLRFRHYSSFSNWDLSDAKGRLRGMVQFDSPNPTVTIPLDRSLHITFGDSYNPEGLAVMEPLWRLERYKFNLEIVQGIGFEHAAGHVSITAEEDLAPGDDIRIKKAVRALLTAQEGNYAAWPKGVKGEVIDVPFAASVALLDTIRYYGILKLATIFMQWAALGTMSPYGSYSSMTDASEFFISVFNSMAEGFVNQADAQIGKRLFELPVNAAAFPQMTRRPRLVVSKAQKVIQLADLGQFLTAFSAIAPLGDDDIIAIRKKSDFLPETLPEMSATEPDPEPTKPSAQPGDGDQPPTEDITPPGDMARYDLQGADTQDGVMVALPIPASLADQVALGIDGALPAEELHLTLAYLGKAEDMPFDRDVFEKTVLEIASYLPPVEGRISGFGRMAPSQDIHVIYASLDSPNLAGLRQAVIKGLAGAGFKISRKHGFNPHITLAYIKPNVKTPVISELIFDSEIQIFDLLGAWAGESFLAPLEGEPAILSKPSRRTFQPAEDEHPTTTEQDAYIDEADIDKAMKAFESWASENDPDMANILKAKVVDSKDGKKK